jgi:hypothetical protein
VTNGIIPGCVSFPAGVTACSFDTIDAGECAQVEGLTCEDGGCQSCPKGQYQDEADSTGCKTCPAGVYGAQVGQTTEACSGECAMGHYCPYGSTSRTAELCPVGTFGGETGLPNVACSGPCSAGHYCETGESSATPSGKLCAAGRYGSTGAVSAQCTGPCRAGYWCSAGSGSPTQHACGSASSYCLTGSSGPIQVQSGHFTTGAGDVSNAINTRTGEEECGIGHYCQGGLRQACPSGSYGNERGETRSDCSGACDAGFFCGEGSTSPSQNACGSVDKYCEAGSSAPIDVPSGYYSIPEDGSPLYRTGILPCPNGFFCPGKTDGDDSGLRFALVYFNSCDAMEVAEGADVGTVLGTVSAESIHGDPVLYAVTGISVASGFGCEEPAVPLCVSPSLIEVVPTTYHYLFDGCPRGSWAETWEDQGTHSLAVCQALCNADENCRALEVTGCTNDPVNCGAGCFHFYGSGECSNLINGRCDTTGDMKAYLKLGDGLPPAPTCVFGVGDGTGGSETYVGTVGTKDECAALVRAQAPAANGATSLGACLTDVEDQDCSCWAEFEMNQITGTSYITCRFTDPVSTTVLSNDHAGNTVGQYFNFNPTSDWLRLLPNGGSHSNVLQCRSGVEVWGGTIVYWNNANGGSIGAAHGHRSQGAAPGQWLAGDVLTNEQFCPTVPGN